MNKYMDMNTSRLLSKSCCKYKTLKENKLLDGVIIFSIGKHCYSFGNDAKTIYECVKDCGCIMVDDYKVLIPNQIIRITVFKSDLREKATEQLQANGHDVIFFNESDVDTVALKL